MFLNNNSCQNRIVYPESTFSFQKKRQRLIQDHALKKSMTVYIGDEVEYKSAKANEIRSVAVT